MITFEEKQAFATDKKLKANRSRLLKVYGTPDGRQVLLDKLKSYGVFAEIGVDAGEGVIAMHDAGIRLMDDQ